MYTYIYVGSIFKIIRCLYTAFFSKHMGRSMAVIMSHLRQYQLSFHHGDICVCMLRGM